MAVAFYCGREHAQAEYRAIKSFYGGKRANAPWWCGFERRAWNSKSLMDWIGPADGCGGIDRFKRLVCFCVASDHYHINNAGVNDMFDVKKLAGLLEEIFTRDNENFSPELVAEELKSRYGDFVMVEKNSDHREMKGTGAPSYSAHLGFCEPLSPQNDVSQNVCLGFGPEAGKSRAEADEPDLHDRERFHDAAVAWLAENYSTWPAGDKPGCRDWVFANKNGVGEWFMPLGITLNSGCVAYRSEWADRVNKTRPSKKCVVIGNGCTSNHKYSVVVGSNVSSDKDYQLKIGSSDIQCSRDISQEEFDEIRKVFATLIGK